MIAKADLETLRAVLLEHVGHHLTEGKEYLVERRLGPVAESLGHPDLASLLRALRLAPDVATVRRVCEAMTTNESLFFRDARPFDLLRDRIVPELLERRRARRRLRIWSAACAAGQEAYSIAMTFADAGAALEGWAVEILGTDYVPAMVERARAGVFNHFEVQRGLPARMLVRHFDRDGDGWRAKPSLRRAVRFERRNLKDAFDGLGTFDVVFCRNVLIYFDAPGKRDVLDRLTAVTASDGYLFLGSSETALGLTDRWAQVAGSDTTLFQRTEASGVGRVTA